MPNSVSQLYFRLCSDHLSIEAIPRRPIRIDFQGIRNSPSDEVELLMWTPHFAVLRSKEGGEVTVRKDGRMVIRNVSSEDAARKTAARILKVITASGQRR